MASRLGRMGVRSRASLWLALTILVVAATMMHPTFASLLAIALIAVLLLALRWAARLEGRASR